MATIDERLKLLLQKCKSLHEEVLQESVRIQKHSEDLKIDFESVHRRNERTASCWR